jgi:DNA repair exonuclease SbcCD ATPase subunit
VDSVRFLIGVENAMGWILFFVTLIALIIVYSISVHSNKIMDDAIKSLKNESLGEIEKIKKDTFWKISKLKDEYEKLQQSYKVLNEIKEESEKSKNYLILKVEDLENKNGDLRKFSDKTINDLRAESENIKMTFLERVHELEGEYQSLRQFSDVRDASAEAEKVRKDAKLALDAALADAVDIRSNAQVQADEIIR